MSLKSPPPPAVPGAAQAPPRLPGLLDILHPAHGLLGLATRLIPLALRLPGAGSGRLGLAAEPIGGQPLLLGSGLRPVGALNVYVGSSFGGFRELFGAIGALNVRFGAGFGGISPLVCMIGTDFGGIRAPVRRVRPLARVRKLRAQAICQRQRPASLGLGGLGPLLRPISTGVCLAQRGLQCRQRTGQ